YGIDQIGSVRRVFASTASALAYGYDPYGVPLQATAPTTDFVYAGMFFNADSGLYLTNYRAFDPFAGRWLSRDPVGEQGNPTGNLYPYVDGNPIGVVDPTGEFGVGAYSVAGFGGGVIGNVAGQILRGGCVDLSDALQAGIQGAALGLGIRGGAELGAGMISEIFKRAFAWLEAQGARGLIAGNPSNSGAILATPIVSNTRLQNIINNLYKHVGKANRTGNGTTQDAIRNELRTGKPTSGTFHSIKGQDSINGLRKFLRNNPNAPYYDRLVAQSLLDELLSILPP
ncbi:MAG: RHS repeat-associated core domain-containing protein, partial [Reyranella sp.]|uniref:RHS repeat-associated core domain-containing protein n=1 Tax=Reyranella sp. TaxID=1929291 RepID=UPI001AC7272C